jgi:hypothetical protein
VRPGLFQIKLDAGDLHKYHHRPPGDATERLYHGVIAVKNFSEDTGTEHTMPVIIWTTTKGV